MAEDIFDVGEPHLVTADLVPGEQVARADRGAVETADGVHAAEIEVLVDRQLVVLVLEGLAGRAAHVEGRGPEQREVPGGAALQLGVLGVAAQRPAGTYSTLRLLREPEVGEKILSRVSRTRATSAALVRLMSLERRITVEAFSPMSLNWVSEMV